MKRLASLIGYWRSLSRSKSFRIRAVIFEDGKFWAAQGLDYDIAAQGETLPEALKSFEQVIIAQLMLDLEQHRTPFTDIPRAPDEFWHMFEKGVLVDPEFSQLLPDGLPPQITNGQELRVFA